MTNKNRIFKIFLSFRIYSYNGFKDIYTFNKKIIGKNGIA